MLFFVKPALLLCVLEQPRVNNSSAGPSLEHLAQMALLKRVCNTGSNFYPLHLHIHKCIFEDVVNNNNYTRQRIVRRRWRLFNHYRMLQVFFITMQVLQRTALCPAPPDAGPG
jgi:hypothetical protein